MKIFINGDQFRAQVYDDETLILDRYAYDQEQLPEFFRFESPFILEVDGEYTILNIKDELSGMSLQELEQEIPVLRKEYENLMIEKIVFLWIDENFNDTPDLEEKLREYEKVFKRISHTQFFRIDKVVEGYRKFKLENKERYQKLKDSVKKQKRIVKILNKVEGKPSKFQIEESGITLSFVFDNGIGLPDIFDSLSTSENIPFIHLHYNGNDWFKVYQHITPPNDWVASNIETNQIRFRILNTSKISKRRKFELMYSEGVWLPSHKLQISFRIDSDIKEEEIQEKVESSITDLNYQIAKVDQFHVKGKFTIEDVSFDKVVFSDLVSVDETFKYFLFFNERMLDDKKGRTALTKKRFSVYYQPNHSYSIGPSLSILLTPRNEQGREFLDVRIMRAKSRAQVESFQNVFVKLVSLFLEKKKDVEKEYKKLLPDATALMKKYKPKPPKVKAADKKSGKRLLTLKTQKPELFRAGYASLCFQSHQPYLIDSQEKAETLREELGEHKVLDYTNPVTGEEEWYACEPREPNDESQLYIYPGLRENKSRNQKYREEVPTLPCCFTEDQYTKQGSILFKKLREYDTDHDIIESLSDVGHILTAIKRAPRGRFGQLPYYISFIAEKAGYSKITKGKQEFVPILRTGVVDCPESFIHCLEKATNDDYFFYAKDERDARIWQVREGMANLPLESCRQELYDYTPEEVRKILLTDGSYIDPGVWITLAEKYYGINIFLYQVDKEHPHGAVLIPRFSRSYLMKKIIPEKPSVCIIKYETSRPWKYQCELVVKYFPESEDTKIERLFFGDGFIREAISILQQTNVVRFMDESKLKKYIPLDTSEEIFSHVESQFIDQDGKTRVLHFDSGVSFVTSPLPPLDLPNVREVRETTLENALEFIEREDFVITEQDGNVETRQIQGLWIKPKDGYSSEFPFVFGYIPVEVTEALESVNFSKETSNDPIRTEDSSYLEEMYKVRKIADFLKQYTFYEYASNPQSFSRDSFKVIEDYEYDIPKLNKRIFKEGNDIMYTLDGKLIAPSEEVVNNLMNFLKVSLLNDRFGVMDYRNQTVIKDYYRTLNDFRKEENTLIFLSRSGISQWKMKQREKTHVIETRFYKWSIEPYFYRNVDLARGKIVLIQNVMNGYNAAIEVCKEWRDNNVNLGFYIKSSETNDKEEVVVVSSERPIVSKFSKNKCYILNLGDNNYASILPLW